MFLWLRIVHTDAYNIGHETVQVCCFYCILCKFQLDRFRGFWAPSGQKSLSSSDWRYCPYNSVRTNVLHCDFLSLLCSWTSQRCVNLHLHFSAVNRRRRWTSMWRAKCSTMSWYPSSRHSLSYEICSLRLMKVRTHIFGDNIGVWTVLHMCYIL